MKITFELENETKNIDGEEAKGYRVGVSYTGDKIGAEEALSCISFLLTKTNLTEKERIEIINKIGNSSIDGFGKAVISESYKSETPSEMFERMIQDERWSKIISRESKLNMEQPSALKILAFVATAVKAIQDLEKKSDGVAKRIEELFLKEVAEV